MKDEMIKELGKSTMDKLDKELDVNSSLQNVRRSYPHEKVNLRIEDIEGMISTYEFLVWQNEGEDREHCKRVLRQLKKSINYA